MRVLSLYKNLSHGGAEMRALDRAGTPAMQAFEQHFCIFTERPGTMDVDFEAHGVTLHRCPLDRRFPLAFQRLLRRLRPDVVHANQQWASAVFLAQAHAAGVPGRVVQFHASNDIVAETPLRTLRNRALRRLILREATALTGVSEGVLDSLFRPSWRQDERFSVDYLGVDLARFQIPADRSGVRAELGVPPSARLVLHVGNMGPAKNHPGLGRIFGRLAQEEPEAHLVVVGRRAAAFEEPMRHALRQSGAEDRCHLLDARDDVPRLMRAADLFLLPSVNEGLPTVILEARAAGLPVVATDLAGVLETARFLDGIDTLSLDAPLDTWSAACVRAMEAGLDDPAPGTNPLEGSPFEKERSAEAHAALWRRSVARR